VREAVNAIAEKPRGEGETAFPDLGTIVQHAKAVMAAENARGRMRRMHAEAEADFWKWVDFRKEQTAKSEQEILNAVATPGYTGRKART